MLDTEKKQQMVADTAAIGANNRKFPHLMIDLETMGNRSFSAIVSIGAVEFDIETGETGKGFYRTISLQSCELAGLNMSTETVMWWITQNDEARKDIFKGNVDLITALYEFSIFCNKEYQVWGNSARFDLGILENAYDAIKIPICWDFRKERCVRTLVSFCPEVKENHIYTGVAHNALSDCYNQISYCTKIWSLLNAPQNKPNP